MSAPLTPDPPPEVHATMDDKLHPAAVSAIVSRFTDVPVVDDLVFPSSMYKDVPPTHQDITHYLITLLNNQPAVFLERYGQHLVSAELPHFSTLRSDYEINYLLSELESSLKLGSPTIPGRASAPARNRRFAKMNRLLKEGEYFSEENMRERAPLLYHQYVGQYLPPGQVGSSTAKPIEKLSEGLFRQLGEFEHRTRLGEEMRAEQMQGSDAEEEEEEEEESDQEEDTAPTVGPQSHTTPDLTSEAHESSSGIEMDPGVAGPSSSTPPAAGIPLSPPISTEEMKSRQDQFLEEMKARFMSGQDGTYVNYKQIDADKLLDLDWLEEESRDAEEKYFDAD